MPDLTIVPPAGLPPVAPEAKPDPRYRLDTDGPASKLIQEAITDARQHSARKARDRQDWYNHLMYRGGAGQWQIWDTSQERYVERGFDPERGGIPEYVPRPATNRFALLLDGIASILDQSDPAKEVSPSTTDAKDIATADVTNDAIPVLLDEIGYPGVKARANKLITLMDKVAIFVWYDTDPKHGTQLIQDFMCDTCGLQVSPDAVEESQACPSCAERGDSGQMVPAVDPASGEKLGVTEPIGRICADLKTSLEFSIPSQAHVLDARHSDIPWVLDHSRMRPDLIRRRWPHATINENQRGSSGNRTSGFSTSIADAVAQLSAPSRAQRTDIGSDGQHQHPIVYRLVHDPIQTPEFDFPQGLYAVMVDDQVVEAGPLPVQDDRKRPIKPVVFRTYAQAPGTAFGKPPGDDLAPMQVTRNLLEALQLLILMHEAAPTTYIPMSIELVNQPTGIPGEMVYYKTLIPGETPSRVQGIGPPEMLVRAIELNDTKMDEQSHLNAVLMGARPAGGDTTAYEVQTLQERGMSAFKEPLDQQVQAEQQLCEILLWIAKRSGWAPRFRQIRTEGGEWEIKQFVAADLAGSVNIRIDPMSAWPKSPLLQLMNLEKALTLGVLPPPAQDPEVGMKALELMHLEMMKPSASRDQKQVARKLARWKAATDPSQIAPPDPVTEALPVHLLLLTNFLKEEMFETLSEQNPPLAAAMKAHVSQIDQLLQAKALQAAMTQAGQVPAPPQGPSPMGGMMTGGDLTPADAQAQAPPPTDPMAAMGLGGELTPADAVPPQTTGISIDQILHEEDLTPISGPTATNVM